MQHRRIIIANPHGFCAGVRRAIESIERAIALHAGPVYCLNEIVHNRRVVSDLTARGVVFVRDIAEVPSGSCLVFSAHGVAPVVRGRAAERGLHVLDATCPFVAKLHRDVRRFVGRGFDVLLIGHRGHDEIEGIRGEAPDRVIVIGNRAEAGSVAVRDPRKLGVLTQTTLSVDETACVMEILRSRFPGLVALPASGICRATLNRQNAVKRLAERAHRILVLGSRNSSNTQRLAEVARESGAQAFLVDSADELSAVPFEGWDTVGVTAGASTPEDTLSEVVAVLQARGFESVENLPGAAEDLHFPLATERDEEGADRSGGSD